MSSDISQKARYLEDFIAEYAPPAMVALSGGVDSSVAAEAVHQVFGAENSLMVLARSESNTDEDEEFCRNLAEKRGWNLKVIRYSELAIPNYAENPVNRCYFCKKELYERLRALAKELGFRTLIEGSNKDDEGDWRPGLQAVRELRICSPLKAMKLSKAEVRDLARHYGLPNHDKPSSPCLSSRVPYGDQITDDKLRQIASAESFLRTLGLTEFRCRHHGESARIEALPQEFSLLLENKEKVVRHLRQLGFKFISLDLAGFKSGNLNPENLVKSTVK